MTPTAQLRRLGQSLWLDTITREMLTSGQLQRHIDVFSVSGLNGADRSAESWADLRSRIDDQVAVVGS